MEERRTEPVRKHTKNPFLRTNNKSNENLAVLAAAEQQLTHHHSNENEIDPKKFTFNEIQNRLTNEVCDLKTGKGENIKVG